MRLTQTTLALYAVAAEKHGEVGGELKRLRSVRFRASVDGRRIAPGRPAPAICHFVLWTRRAHRALEFFELLSLFRGQLGTDFAANMAKFVLHFRVNAAHNLAGSFLALLQDLGDLLILFRGEIEVTVHAVEKFAAHEPWRGDIFLALKRETRHWPRVI